MCILRRRIAVALRRLPPAKSAAVKPFSSGAVFVCVRTLESGGHVAGSPLRSHSITTSVRSAAAAAAWTMSLVPFAVVSTRS
jgi:hypothetical protein